MPRFALYRALAALTVLVFAAGCPQSGPSPVPTKGGGSSTQPLVLLVVDDPALGRAIAREWRSRTEGELQVQDIGLADALQASRLPGDAVIFPSGHLGHLVERGLIAPLDEQALAAGDFNRADLLDQVRLRDITWGNRTLAVPLGSPQLLVVYRRDLLEQQGLAPPADWNAYQQVVERLSGGESSGGDAPSSMQPTIEPLAAGWAGQTLLARAASYVTHRDQVSPLFDYATLEPLIASEPYVRALTELVAANKAAPPKQRLTPAQAIEEVYAGRAAMAIAWPPTVRESTEPCRLPLAFSPLPGSTESYQFAQKRWDRRPPGDETQVPLLGASGRLAGVTTTTTDPRGAQHFLSWLAGSEASAIVGPTSAATAPFRASQLPQVQRWTSGLEAEPAKAYATALQQSSSLARYVSLRMPGRDEYLAALDEAVWQALAGEMSPAEALSAAGQRWQAITAAHGIESQRQALRRGLGFESLPAR